MDKKNKILLTKLTQLN